MLSKMAAGAVHEPLRIVVAGGSVSVFVTPARRNPGEGTYGELLPRLLSPHGVVAEISHQGQWFDLVNDYRRRYEQGLRNRFPDVLILNYGMGECQPNFLPTWAARHFASWDISTAAIPVLYRKHLAPRVWRVVRRWQQVAAARTTNHSWRLAPGRFYAEMEHVIEMARQETQCLVLILDCDPPGDRFVHWIPGMWERWERYQGILNDLVTDLADPDVRLVPASASILDDLGFDVGLPDGIHRSAVAHVKTAELLTEQILDWLSTAPTHSSAQIPAPNQPSAQRANPG